MKKRICIALAIAILGILTAIAPHTFAKVCEVGEKVMKCHWTARAELFVGLAVAALFLLCVPAGGFEVEGGDLLLIGCAICFTGQILGVDRYAARVNGAALARDEFLMTGALSMILALFLEPITWEGIRGALIPILYTGIMSSAVGYTLQIIGQRDVNPTVASLLMCMESVFAVLTGALLLGERLTARELAGCALMFLAVILAQTAPALRRKRTHG